MNARATIRIKAVMATAIVAALTATVILSCGNDRRTENSAVETKNAETETADAETGTQANDVAVVADQQFNHDINYDIFIDPRDNQTYRIVRIGNLTWLAQNLNHQTENSWCYKDNNSICVVYGRLYNWNDAMTACPAGWRLPTIADWRNLFDAVGGEDNAGKKLKSRTDWLIICNRVVDFTGTDDFGFSARPGGGRWSDGDFGNLGFDGCWWSGTDAKDDVVSAPRWCIRLHTDNVVLDWFDKLDAVSVRCVRD